MTELKITRSYKTYEPISLLPADDWRAVFAYDNEGRYAHATTMIAFALTKVCYIDVYENGYEATSEEVQIMGYTASDIGIHPAKGSHNFTGYLAPSKGIPDHMEQQAKEYVLANSTGKIMENHQ